MKTNLRLVALFLLLSAFLSMPAWAQSSGTVEGVVKDPSGGVVPNVKVEILNRVSHFDSMTNTDSMGMFRFPNVPFNTYQLTVEAGGFSPYSQNIDVRSVVTLTVPVDLKLAGAATAVEVTEQAPELAEIATIAHTDVDRALFDKLPLESASSSLSSLVTLASPGVAADSNGLFHGMGDHASNSFSVDGQPITDQQSKVFSNQIPLDSVQSMEVIQGAPPAEYGGKTSLVINVTTRSGQGVTAPHGDVIASYGTFGSTNLGGNVAYGGQKWGNFVSLSGLNSGRFLDPPEFTVMHAKGNQQNAFDRIDYQFSNSDWVHMNLGFTRSWFQNPNSYDQQYHPGLTDPITGGLLGPADQRSQIKTFNIAPTYTHSISPAALFTFGAFWRQDQYNYYPSAYVFNDFAPDLQSETVGQSRRLMNVGGRSDLSYVKGIHNLKIGAQYEHTFVTEGDNFGIVDPGVVPGLNCQDANGNALPGTPCAALQPYDLTQGGVPYLFHGHGDIKELSMYVQDAITTGPWTFNLGIRGDVYNGLAIDRQAEPRVGIAYHLRSSDSVLRISYARTMETPFNENLVIGSTGCSDPFLAILIPPPGVTCNLGPITPGIRNEFHAGIQQAIGRYLVVDAEYIWKYTHNAFDFGIVGATPVAFPIEWTKSKIPGYTVRLSVPQTHGFTAQIVMSGVAARFFLPQIAGVPIIPVGNSVFRIDHDEIYNQTTHFQYQPWKRGPWLGFNWRYDSGLVSGAIPCSAPTATCFATTPVDDGGGAMIPSGQVAFTNAITGGPLTADQEFQAQFTCNGKLAAPDPLGAALATCSAAGLGSKLLKIPGPGLENDDHSPQRIQSRHLFDIAFGHDNLFNGDTHKWSARISVVNLTNSSVLYNFLSTFSGTHYVSPRAITGTIGFHF